MSRCFRLRLVAVPGSAMHIAGPGRTLPLVDRPVQLDEWGRPHLPASSVRGRVRVHLERLLRALGQPVCSPPRPERMCPHAGVGPAYCMACRVFGSPERSAAAMFDDLRLQSPPARLELPQRTQVSLSRRLNTAQATRLFVTETTPWAAGSALQFVGSVSGRAERDEVGWLIAAAHLVEHIGGNKARGLGRVRLQAAEIEWWNVTERQWQADDIQLLVEEAIEHADIGSD